MTLSCNSCYCPHDILSQNCMSHLVPQLCFLSHMPFSGQAVLLIVLGTRPAEARCEDASWSAFRGDSSKATPVGTGVQGLSAFELCSALSQP